ncbi:polyprenyl synthetase family protein [Amycolatopsis sp. TRM77291]
MTGAADRFIAEVGTYLSDVVGDLPPLLRSRALDLANNSGKRLRIRMLHACSRFGHPENRRLVKMGSLIELVHLASLMHDDVIDRATVRRGRPATHVEAGNEIAVLTGVGCMALVGQEAAGLGQVVSRVVSDSTADLAYGELLDIERAFDTDLSDDDYLSLVSHKTGALFKLAAVLGAGEAGIAPELVDRLAVFGEQAGVAFQIADDCLDLWVATSGKSRGTDHLLGLFGLPTLYALRAGVPGLKELLLSPGLHAGDLDIIRELVANSDGVDKATAVAREYYGRALRGLGPLANTAAGSVLVGLTDAMWQK